MAGHSVTRKLVVGCLLPEEDPAAETSWGRSLGVVVEPKGEECTHRGKQEGEQETKG